MLYVLNIGFTDIAPATDYNFHNMHKLNGNHFPMKTPSVNICIFIIQSDTYQHLFSLIPLSTEYTEAS